MPIAQTELLFKLIKSLDKSEKRHFKLYVRRLSSNKEGLFLRLFELMDKSESPDDLKFQKKLGIRSGNQYSNTKRHLYSQIIKSLRLIHISRDDSINIRENLDYATILYKKGLYKQSLIILDRIRTQAKTGHNTLLFLQIIELEKKIESRHITRSRKIKNRIEGLVSDSKRMRDIVFKSSALSDLSLNIQGLYIKHGFARNKRDTGLYKAYFESQSPELDTRNASFYEYILWQQSKVWLHYMCLEFKESQKHALAWAEKFKTDKVMQEIDPDLYIRGIHYILTTSFYLNDKELFTHWWKDYDKFRQDSAKRFNESSRILDFIYFWNAKLNRMILLNDYSQFQKTEKEIHRKLSQFKGKIDEHRCNIFYYKLGMIYMYTGDYSTALDYFNKILNNQAEHLRSDIFCYSRLLHLLCHYNLNNFNIIPNLLISVRNSFITHAEWNNTLEEIFGFIKKGTKAMNFGLNDELAEMIRKLEALESHTFEAIPLVYFDFNGWFKSQLSNTTVARLN